MVWGAYFGAQEGRALTVEGAPWWCAIGQRGTPLRGQRSNCSGRRAAQLQGGAGGGDNKASSSQRGLPIERLSWRLSKRRLGSAGVPSVLRPTTCCTDEAVPLGRST
jgi:hypothetical protein